MGWPQHLILYSRKRHVGCHVSNGDRIAAYLEHALDSAEHPEARFWIRTAMQLAVDDRQEAE